MTWDFPYVKPESHLPPIPPRNTMVSLPPVNWHQYWTSRGLASPLTAVPPTYANWAHPYYQYQKCLPYTANQNYFQPGGWQCGDKTCALCYPGNRNAKSYFSEYWQKYLNKSTDESYIRWWSLHWPYFYGQNPGQYWYYPSTA